GRGHQPLERRLVRDARGDADRGAGAEFRIELGRDRVAGVLLAARHHHFRAMLRERLDAGAADPARRSGDHRDLAGEIEPAHAPASPATPPPAATSPGSRSTVFSACVDEALPSMIRFLMPWTIPVSRKRL